MLEFDHAPNGIIGLETAVSLTLDRLIHRDLISLTQMVRLLSCNPAQIFKLEGGTLKIGSRADVTIIDPNRKIRIDVSRFQSKSRNTPFDGWELRGAVARTIVDGDIVWRAF
jgi:dihydroorotase